MPSSGGSVSDAPVNKVVDGQRHYLAYITPDEGKSLQQQGGKEVVTDQGIPAYPGHHGVSGSSAGVEQGGSSSSSSSGGGGGGVHRDKPSKVSTSVVTTDRPPGGGDPSMTYTAPSEGGLEEGIRHHRVDTPQQTYDQTQLDREARASKFDYEGDAAGSGTITSNTYNADTGKFDVEQTTGTISAIDYQRSNLSAYLDSPDVSDKAKAKALNQLQAIQNSQLLGTAQGKSDIEAKDFVIDNLTSSLDYIKGQTKYSKYTSMIDEEATTLAEDFKDNPLQTVVKSGGLIGTMGRSIYDSYKNKKAMNVLGYTGEVYNPETGDYGKDRNRMLTGGATKEERGAMTQLAPSAPYIAAGTGQPTSSVASSWFANLGNTTQGFNFNTAYTAAKVKVAQRLGNSSAVGQLAVKDSSFFNWLKDNSLDKGIL